eukprot:GHVU01142198.1.p2 GENE.GHVU01142198.1~~GHVU01142198.1.p2  ORF type:complete len:114 (-),score=14.02 GHVU01142198.1:190-531(-)
MEQLETVEHVGFDLLRLGLLDGRLAQHDAGETVHRALRRLADHMLHLIEFVLHDLGLPLQTRQNSVPVAPMGDGGRPTVARAMATATHTTTTPAAERRYHVDSSKQVSKGQTK